MSRDRLLTPPRPNNGGESRGTAMTMTIRSPLRAGWREQLPMNQQLVDRIQHCPNLPSLPGVAVQVVELAQNPDADIAEIARLITKDSALSGKILRTVNSSFYARTQPIATL